MASHDPEELWPKLDEIGLEEVKKKLAQGVFGERKKPVVNEWVDKTTSALEAPTYMYHPAEAPNGKLFTAKETLELEKNGWYDTPDNFPTEKNKNHIKAFLRKEWKWLVATLLIIIGLVITALKT